MKSIEYLIDFVVTSEPAVTHVICTALEGYTLVVIKMIHLCVPRLDLAIERTNSSWASLGHVGTRSKIFLNSFVCMSSKYSKYAVLSQISSRVLRKTDIDRG